MPERDPDVRVDFGVLMAEHPPTAEAGRQSAKQGCAKKFLGQQRLVKLRIDSAVEHGQAARPECGFILLKAVKQFTGDRITHVMGKQVKLRDVQGFQEGLGRIHLA